MRHMATPTNVHIGNRIRDARLALGLSQRDIECEGISYAYISRVENGTRNPSIPALVKLAARLREEGAPHMTALYLLTGVHDGPCLVCGRQEPTKEVAAA